MTALYETDRSCGQRCDAGRPCTPCRGSRKECTYDEDSPTSSASQETTPSRSMSSSKSLVAFKGIRVCARSPSQQPTVQSPPQSFSYSSVPHPISSALVPRVPPEYLKVSDVSTSDLHLNLYVVREFEFELLGLIRFVSRLNTLRRYMRMGLRLRGDKQEAIMRGDLCGTVVHPFFVHQAHALGMHYCATLPDGKTAIIMQARYAQLTWESMADISKDQDHFLLLEAMFALASSCVLLRWLNITQTYLLKAIRIANERRMTFVPEDSPAPVFSEDVHEHIVQLSQLIYLENFLFLTRNGVEPNATSRLEKEFRTELEVTNLLRSRHLTRVAEMTQASHPFVFDTCPLVMRTRGVLLIRDAIFVLGVYPQQSELHMA